MSRKKKIYISGRITGLPEIEYRKIFKDAEDKLLKEGWNVINPCRLEYIKNTSWSDMILQDLHVLDSCDAIYMLNNWQDSSYGCLVEYNFAKGKGLEILFEENKQTDL